MSHPQSTEISSAPMEICSPTRTSVTLPIEWWNEPDRTRRLELQRVAAQQEYLRLKERLSPLGYSELALRSMSQSYGGPVLP
jgi:hypothetical protein